MQIKEVKPINFLFYRTKVKISDLQNLLPIGQELFQEAVQQKLTITGPVHWHYFDFTGNESQPFTIEIALPVQEVLADYDGKFHFKRTDSFKCVSLIHDGGWSDIPKSYSRLMQYMADHKLQPGNLNREVYVNVDFSYPEANTTEIQMGIQ
jgi:effector-binding domain-containing protein